MQTPFESASLDKPRRFHPRGATDHEGSGVAYIEFGGSSLRTVHCYSGAR